MQLWYGWYVSSVFQYVPTHFQHVLCICNGILPGLNAIKTLWLQLILIIRVGKRQGQLELTLSPKIWVFPAYFRVICYATAYLIQVPCYHNCLAVLLWSCMTGWVGKTVYKTWQKTAMTQHIGLGSSSSHNAFIWKWVPSPPFWSILNPVLSSLVYILYTVWKVSRVICALAGE